MKMTAKQCGNCGQAFASLMASVLHQMRCTSIASSLHYQAKVPSDASSTNRPELVPSEKTDFTSQRETRVVETRSPAKESLLSEVTFSTSQKESKHADESSSNLPTEPSEESFSKSQPSILELSEEALSNSQTDSQRSDSDDTISNSLIESQPLEDPFEATYDLSQSDGTQDNSNFCDDCQKELKSYLGLVRHCTFKRCIRKPRQPRQFEWTNDSQADHCNSTCSCDDCGNTFHSRTGLILHCTLQRCRQKSRDHSRYRRKYESQIEITNCQDCGRNFKSAGALSSHSLMSISCGKLRRQLFICPLCNTSMSAARQYYHTHFSSSCGTEKAVCDECGIGSSGHDIGDHVAACVLGKSRKSKAGRTRKSTAGTRRRTGDETAKGAHICDVCSYTTFEAYQLGKHKESPIACQLNLKRQSLQHQLGLSITSNPDHRSGGTTLTCPRCDYKTTHGSSMRKHMASRVACGLRRQKLRVEELNGRCDCENCGRTFASSRRLLLHLDHKSCLVVRLK